MEYNKIKNILDRGLKKELEILFEYLESYDTAYHGIGKRIVSDTEYDIIKSTLKKHFPNHKYFKNVGSPVFAKKIVLPYIMGSLDKVGPDKVEEWIIKNGNDVYATEKLDGASILVKWKDGEIEFATTRGDGKVGQNITEKAKHFIPDIPIKETVILRGEALLTGNSHKELGMKNRRNGVAGLLNREDFNQEDVKKIKVIFYEILEAPVSLNNENSRHEYIRSTLKLQTPYYITVENPKLLITLMNKMMRSIKETGEYDIDGFVLTINNSERQDVMIPSNKIAYKVNEEAVPVTVTGVEWNVSKGGKLIPTVLIEPTDISGSTISRTTGFNAEFILDNDINTGAVIGLVKAGDVIPYITEIFTPSTIPHNITLCPSCEGKVMWKGVDLVCANPNDCIDSNIKRTAYFFKKLGSEYITETTIKNLGISSIEEAYELDELIISEIDGFGIKKAEQIVYEIQKTLNTTPIKLLAAFSIDGIGETVSTQIIGLVSDFGELFKLTDLRNVVGPKTTEKFLNGIGKYENLYNFLLSKGLKFEEREMGTLSGKSIALTGKGPMKRNELIKMIQEQGGNVGTVSKTTDYLVCEDPNSGSGKLEKASKYGTKIISYDELMELLQ